jgi:Ser/Thr protein kinase RdoA (MazF antagonist)
VTDAAVVGRILREYRQDNIAPASVRRLSGSVSGARVGYQLALPDGGTVLVRAFRCDEPLPAYLQGCGTASVTDWLLGRTATLEWLASRGYPAPRVVATRTGDPVGVAGIWLTLATTTVPGPPLSAGEEGLGLLGEALGGLHALDATGAGPGNASWHPEAAIRDALRRLDTVAALLPAHWRSMHGQFRRTLLALQGAALPMTVVHGDAWPGNVIRTGEAQVTLIDWENGGLGLPVVDLGQCLLECHLDPGLPEDRPEAWHVQPDPHRIAAVLNGYTRWRRLADAELAILPEGIRFGAAYIGAIHFERALIDGVHGAIMDARLGLLRNRIAVSQAIADLAARHLGEH